MVENHRPDGAPLDAFAYRRYTRLLDDIAFEGMSAAQVPFTVSVEGLGRVFFDRREQRKADTSLRGVLLAEQTDPAGTETSEPIDESLQITAQAIRQDKDSLPSVTASVRKNGRAKRLLARLFGNESNRAAGEFRYMIGLPPAEIEAAETAKKEDMEQNPLKYR